MNALTTIDFAPLVPVWLIAALGVVGLALVIFGAVRRARGIIWRAGAIAVGLLTLANPLLVEELRQPVPNVAVVVVDDSPSQDLGKRRE